MNRKRAMGLQSTTKGVGDALGLRDGETQGYSRMWLCKRLSEGLPLSSYDRLTQKVFADDMRAPNPIISVATIKRRRQDKRRLSPEASQRLERAARVWTMAMDIYKDEHDARRFLNTPHMMLHEETPLSVAVSNDVGAHAVVSILGRLKYGSAA